MPGACSVRVATAQRRQMKRTASLHASSGKSAPNVIDGLAGFGGSEEKPWFQFLENPSTQASGPQFTHLGGLAKEPRSWIQGWRSLSSRLDEAASQRSVVGTRCRDAGSRGARRYPGWCRIVRGRGLRSGPLSATPSRLRLPTCSIRARQSLMSLPP